MSDYTRLTVTGSKRRVEIVVPSTEPLGATLPGLIELLNETDGTVARPLTLVTVDGEQLDLDRTPVQQDLAEAAFLRLVRIDAAPPPPAVIDLADVAAEARDEHPGRWNDRSREITGLVGVGLAAMVAGALLPLASVIVFWVLVVTVVLLAAIAVPLAKTNHQRLSAVLNAASAGFGLALGWVVLALSASGLTGVYTAMLVVIAAWSVSLILGVGVGLKNRGALAGGLNGLALVVVALVLMAVGFGPAIAAQVTAVISVFAVGSLPWIALSVAGLTSMDDQIGEGTVVARPDGLGAVESAYSTITWAVVANSALLAASGWVLVNSSDVWGYLIAGTAATATMMRTRALPLRAQVWSMWAAVGVMMVTAWPALLAAKLSWVGVAVFVGIAVIAAAASLVQLRPHQRARLRGLGNLLETLSVVALLPLLLGGFGLYAELLALFGGTG